MTTPRPIAMLIAALGGEGGGVLTDWIVSAAASEGYPVQSTSIPGVAQRTGATTYYIEILPVTFAALGAKRPVLGLTPGGGDGDVVPARERMEGGRGQPAGFSRRLAGGDRRRRARAPRRQAPARCRALGREPGSRGDRDHAGRRLRDRDRGAAAHRGFPGRRLCGTLCRPAQDRAR